MKTIKQLDEKLSKRYISLDPKGYFIIYIDRNQNLICAKYFTNIINDKGLAVDPENGEVISVRNKVTRSANQIFTARSAKELCIKIIENNDNCLITMLDHAAYLGREFMKAEIALTQEIEYIQD
ncbi:DUF4346 domain-containing protein [Candidatus Atelocyanobacterium thalassae]|uniref:DUF4346 domain-containing protein n=1 Tax=cyanobacterium endosymbiont of Braarudosphaera bigelowii TaxID=1285375 RepID=A0ABN6K041_9CHRO|nr:DUF4346 domain-containing protein [Candidatus Atelocyanobacterium thalassa]BDA39368.1 hypothetical protein CPARK_000020700 [cyanobacterium endosymbiont of Braarudosphaera bigelowii]